MKAIFTPFSVVLGLLAGLVAKRIFEKAWSAFDDEAAPDPKYRRIPLAKLAIALAVEGAIARLVRGLVDHGSRHGWAQLAGTWPGAESPEEDEE
jgi:hypothetical protein